MTHLRTDALPLSIKGLSTKIYPAKYQVQTEYDPKKEGNTIDFFFYFIAKIIHPVTLLRTESYGLPTLL
jgi:hypothetical protein